MTAIHTHEDSDASINFQLVPATEKYVISLNKTIGNPSNVGIDPPALLYKSHPYHLYALAAVVIGVVLTGLICTVMPFVFRPNAVSHLILYRKFVKLVPGHRFASSYINQFIDMTVGEVLIIVLFLLLNAVWAVYGFLWDTAKMFGIGFSKMIILSWIFVLIPVTRYSVLHAIFGISFERSLKYHKWLAPWLFAASTLHGGAEIIYFREQFLYLLSLDTDMFPLFGIIAWFAMVILLLLSFGPIRRKAWEFFQCTHLPLAVISVGFSAAHGEGFINLLPYVGASLILFGIDLFLRLVIGFG